MRIAVLGAGITGVACAEWLRRDGHEVVLVDRVEPGDPGQTSYGNAGVLAAGSVIPVPVPGLLAKAPGMLLDPDGPLFLKWRYLPQLMPWLLRFLAHGRRSEVERISAALATLVADTVDQHARLAEGTGAERFVGTGRYVYLYASEAEAAKDALGEALRAASGIRVERLDRAALEARDPHLGPAYGYGLAVEGSGHLTDPGGYTAALFGHFLREGGRFLRGAIEAVRPVGEAVEVAVDANTLTADRAVVAMGAWSGPIAKALGHEPRLESERGYHLLLRNPSRMPPDAYMLADGKSVATPMDAGLRIAGLVEFGGLEAGPSVGPTRLQRKLAQRLYPDLEWEGEEVWLGHRPSTVDSLPLIGEATKAPGVYFAFGAQHLGLTMSAKTGRLIADLVAGRRPNIDLAPFRADRFDR